MNNNNSVWCRFGTSFIAKGTVRRTDHRLYVPTARSYCTLYFLPSHDDFSSRRYCFLYSGYYTVFFYRFPAQDVNVSTVSAARNRFRRSCCSLNYNMMKFGSKNSTNTPIKCTIRLLDDSQLLDSEFQVQTVVCSRIERINVSYIINSLYKI